MAITPWAPGSQSTRFQDDLSSRGARQRPSLSFTRASPPAALHHHRRPSRARVSVDRADVRRETAYARTRPRKTSLESDVRWYTQTAATTPKTAQRAQPPTLNPIALESDCRAPRR
jgi:hypothetical protein